MSFRITGLDPAPFAHLHAMTDAQLAGAGVQRVRVEEKPAAPCRITLDDAEPGEVVLLLNFTHHPADTPYRQQGPIFIREALARCETLDALPPALERRTLSLRGFDGRGMMVDAVLIAGAEAGEAIARLFDNAEVSHIHAHYATRGCYAALIERA